MLIICLHSQLEKGSTHVHFLRIELSKYYQALITEFNLKTILCLQQG
jgi:hypothetical protein